MEDPLKKKGGNVGGGGGNGNGGVGGKELDKNKIEF